jgi:hypothetical protein
VKLELRLGVEFGGGLGFLFEDDHSIGLAGEQLGDLDGAGSVLQVLRSGRLQLAALGRSGKRNYTRMTTALDRLKGA